MSFTNSESPQHASTPARKCAPVQRIVLTGFMGSGKTTVGRSLAERLGWGFVDLDNAIEQRDGRTVAQIFAESGEPAFRRLESESLASCLREAQIVLGLGGGTLETPSNRDAIAASPQTCAVLLSASFETLYDRCQQIATAGSQLPVRPLLGDREAAMARLAHREPVYRECADLVLDTTGQQPQESVDTLLKLLKDML